MAKMVHVKAYTRKSPTYSFTKTFSEGPLKGLTIKQKSSVKPKSGKVGGGNLGSASIVKNVRKASK